MAGRPGPGMGRPTKLTPEVQAEICRNIEAGGSRDSAAAAAGIAAGTLKEWLARGRSDVPPREGLLEDPGIYADFAAALEDAERKQKFHDEVSISDAASKGIWQAAAWRLERKYPREYGRFQRIEADVNATAVHGQMPAEDAAKVLADIIAARKRGNGSTSPPPDSTS